MNINFVGSENIATYLAIIFATFSFSFFIWKILFLELEVFEVSYTKKVKQRSLWLIFSSLISLIIWWQLLQHLLSRLQ